MTSDLKSKVAKVAETYADDSMKTLARAILALSENFERCQRTVSKIVDDQSDILRRLEIESNRRLG